MAEAKPNLVRIVRRNDGRFEIRIVSSNGRVLVVSDTIYSTKGAATTAAKSLVTKPLELEA